MPHHEPDQVGARRPSLRDRKRLRTQEAIYDAAVRLIVERGYENVNVDDICEEAEVGRATFFRYFGTKAGLMHEFDRRIVVEIESILASDGPTTAAEQLRVVQTVMADAWAKAHPNLRALGLDYVRSTAISDMGRAVTDIKKVTARIVEHGYESGELRPLLPADTVADIFVTALRIGVRSPSASPSAKRARSRNAGDTRAVVDLFLEGLASGI